MRTIHIKQKLSDIGVSTNDLILGDYDFLGRLCCEKQRDRNDPLYKSVGCFFRPNMERGILICSLMQRYGLKSFLEIGFGRGYTTFCVAKMLHELGIDGSVATIDVNYDEQHLKMLGNIFPNDWFKYVKYYHGTSVAVANKLENERFDLIYIDGDHSYDGTKQDWELYKERFNAIMVFDDYHLPSKNDPGIQCARAIDEIDWQAAGCLEPELVITDRRIFIDDRQLPDDKIDYGQVVLTKQSAALVNDLW